MKFSRICTSKEKNGSKRTKKEVMMEISKEMKEEKHIKRIQ